MEIALVRLELGSSSEPYIRFEQSRLQKYRCAMVDKRSEYIDWRAHLMSLVGMPFKPATPSVKLVHSHFGPDAQYGRSIAKIRGVPHVISVHGYDVCYSPLQYVRLMRSRFVSYALKRRRLLDSADLILCCSEYLQRRVVSLGVAREKTRVHYLGVDLETIDSVNRDVTGERSFKGMHVVCVGRLVPIKGQDVLIRAIPEIRHKVPNLKVTLVGAGPRLAHLKRLARSLGVEEVAEFVGALSHADTLRVMGSADVVVVPSRRLARVEEAFGLVAAEAMALGVPVVASETGGLAELLDQGRLGVLVPQGCPSTLARGVIQAVETSSPDRLKLAEDAVRTHYDASQQLLRLERIFDELVESQIR